MPKDCCVRCKTVLPTVCCDLCNPDTISCIIPCLAAILTLPKATQKPKQIKVTLYDSSMAEQHLRHNILAWCECKVHDLFGNIDYFTPNIFLHLSVLDFILDLAHVHKLNSILDLKNQTSWCFAEEYGRDIIRFIEQHCPSTEMGHASASSLFVSTPLHSQPDMFNSSTDNTLLPAALKTRAQPQCGECGILGHRSESATLQLWHAPCTTDL